MPHITHCTMVQFIRTRMYLLIQSQNARGPSFLRWSYYPVHYVQWIHICIDCKIEFKDCRMNLMLALKTVCAMPKHCRRSAQIIRPSYLIKYSSVKQFQLCTLTWSHNAPFMTFFLLLDNMCENVISHE